MNKLFQQLCESIINGEAGDVRSILDELIPHPTDDQLVIILHVINSMEGYVFYNNNEGWFYYES